MTRLLPERLAIHAFGNGGFRFGDYSHRGSLLVSPSGMRAWSAIDVRGLVPADFDGISTERDDFDFLLIGTGAVMAPLPKDVAVFLSTQNVNYDVMSTSSAVHTYNVVLGEGRRVAAALLAVP